MTHVTVFHPTGDFAQMLSRALAARGITVKSSDNFTVDKQHLFGTDIRMGESMRAAMDRVAEKFVGFSTKPLAVLLADELRDDSAGVHRLHYVIAEGH